MKVKKGTIINCIICTIFWIFLLLGKFFILVGALSQNFIIVIEKHFVIKTGIFGGCFSFNHDFYVKCMKKFELVPKSFL